MNTKTKPNPNETSETIKLGIDARAKWFYVARQRRQIGRERLRLQAMGRSLLASHGIHVTGEWWKGKAWSGIEPGGPRVWRQRDGRLCLVGDHQRDAERSRRGRAPDAEDLSGVRGERPSM